MSLTLLVTGATAGFGDAITPRTFTCRCQNDSGGQRFVP